LTSVRAVGDPRSSAAPPLYLLGVALSLVVASCGQAGKPEELVGSPVGDPAASDVEIQGHRGARGLKPENTFPAFEAALDLLVPTLELDLHLTADGHLVVLHDPGINRLKCGLSPVATDAPDPDSRIRDPMPLRIAGLSLDQVRQYRCDRNPDPEEFPDQNNDPTALAGDDYGIVELEQLFEFVDEYSTYSDKTEGQRANAAQVRFNIETKRDPRDPTAIDDGFDGVNPGTFELALLEEISAAGLADRVTIQSFDHRSLWSIRSVDPAMTLVALTSGRIPDFDDLVARGATIWSPNMANVTQGAVEAAHSAGLDVVVWTVNETTDMLRLIAIGVDGLITDRPDIAMSLVTSGE